MSHPDPNKADPDSIERVVLDVLREHCDVGGKINLDSALQSDLGLDSVGMLTLLVELENHYGLELEDQTDAPPQTVREVVRLVNRSLRVAAGGRPSTVTDATPPPAAADEGSVRAPASGPEDSAP